MDIKLMRDNLKQKLATCGWDRVLSDFIEGPQFYILMTNLEKAYEEGKATPPIDQVFNLFYECPYKDLNIVLIGQDPYTDEGVADGLAFSCGNTMNPEPEQVVMFHEIERTVYKDEKWYAFEPSLKRWANQGILLLNTALTAETGKLGAHYEIWKPFVQYLFQKLADMNTGLIYIFVGDSAKEWANKVPESNYKFYCYHPNTACYSGIDWESNDVFIRANEILEANNGLKIIW